MASGTNPGTTYTITTGDPGVYHEDRVVVTTVGATSITQMFRVDGAMLEADGWHFVDTGTAYATVQNPDGSIHYFTYSGTSPWLTSAWQGSDNNTVYNAVDFGVTANGSASVNAGALSSLFTAMAGAAGLGGGMLWIPRYNFPVNASSALNAPVGCIFQGLGTGGYNNGYEFFHFSISDGAATVASTFFSNSGNHTPGGTIFRNLAFQWIEPGYVGDTCLNFNYSNNIAQECTFTDCPLAINFQGLQQSAKQCSISYGNDSDNPVQNNTTAIVMAGIQCEVSGPSEMNGGGLSGSTTATFCSIGGGLRHSNHSTFRNLHIFGWDYGIDYSDINNVVGSTRSGTQNTVIDGCHMEISRTCVYMTPYNPGGGSTGQIFDQTIVSCNLQKGQDSNDPSPIVYIDSNGGLASNIGPIMLANNLIFSNVTDDTKHEGVAQSNQYGVEIGVCESVSIIGGQISQVGGNNPDVIGTANICISGDAVQVSLDSVNLGPLFYGANHGDSTGTNGSGPSEYALLISGSPASVQVNNCYMAGFDGPAVSITGSPSSVYITNCVMQAGSSVSVTGSPSTVFVANCVGYNDQNATINTLAHISTGVAYSAHNQGSNGGTSYYGPSFVVFTANAFGGSFQVNGGAALTLLPTQVVTLTLASPYDTIQFNTHVPAAIQWTGR